MTHNANNTENNIHVDQVIEGWNRAIAWQSATFRFTRTTKVTKTEKEQDH